MKKLISLIFVVGLAISSIAAQPESNPRIYEIKWREARDIAGILQGFQVLVSISETFNTLTVHATPEHHALIQELIRKYDVPAKTIEFQFHVLRASRGGGGIQDGLPESIQKVLKEISSLMKYDTFELLAAPVLRATEGKRASVSGKGVSFYHLAIERPSVVETQQGKRLIRVDEFMINFEISTGLAHEGQPTFKPVGMQNSFSIKDGETVVLGASQMGVLGASRMQADEPGNAIVTVVTARILD